MVLLQTNIRLIELQVDKHTNSPTLAKTDTYVRHTLDFIGTHKTGHDEIP